MVLGLVAAGCALLGTGLGWLQPFLVPGSVGQAVFCLVALGKLVGARRA